MLTLESANKGNHLSCCSFVPYVRITVLTSVLWTSHITETEGSTFASSSIAMIAEVKDDSAPPCSALVSIPMSYGLELVSKQDTHVAELTPWLKRPLIIEGFIDSFSSISRTLGATTSLANRCTVS